VWDGDQVLYEISAPGGSSATAAQMEADTGLAVPFFLNQQHTAVAGFFPYGRVMYEHGGGIDAPLGVVRMEYSSELHDPQVIVPHPDWRGTYDRGTTIVGSCVVYSSNGTQLAPPPDSTPSNPDQYGGVAGGGTYNGTKEHCIDVDWPGAYTWSARQYRRGYSGPDSWMGSLIFESRDASGLYYRRNRYYDSEKGRFTQEDPIGLAGGVNVYGFADGDPIMYSDPYGLWIDWKTRQARVLWNELARHVNHALRSNDRNVRNAARDLMNIMNDAFRDRQHKYSLDVHDFDAYFEKDTGGGEEGKAGPNAHFIRVDDLVMDRDDLNVAPWITLAHELGGAQASRHGNDDHEGTWFRTGTAVRAENLARTIVGCPHRRSHSQLPPACMR
jgi:RHS repeat-associated protein